MAETSNRRALEAQADQRVTDILRAAASWAKEAPAPLAPAVRAVCIRLGEMVADQRNYLPPLPEPQETERGTVLSLMAARLASTAAEGLERELAKLTEMELRSTASWALEPSAQAQWITTAIQFLDESAARLPAPDRPDAYWAEDVVAGIIASVRAVIGIDELHARTEARYSGSTKKVAQEEE